MALPYAVTVVAVLGTASAVSVRYAHGMGVRVLDDAGDVLRLRLVPYAVLLVAFLAGALRATPSGGFGAGFAQGAAAGAVAGMVCLVWSGLRARRREQREDEA